MRQALKGQHITNGAYHSTLPAQEKAAPAEKERTWQGAPAGKNCTST